MKRDKKDKTKDRTDDQMENQMENKKEDKIESESQQVTQDENSSEKSEEAEILDGPNEKPENDEYQKQYCELQDKYMRTLAEFDNFRKRTIKEKSSMYDDGVKNTVEKFLPVMDNFERALGAVPDPNDNFYKGVLMIFKQMEAAFFELGVEVISAKGENFDTNLHFAVSHMEDENYGENEVVEELQKGYKYKEKVIRPSMVKVAN